MKTDDYLEPIDRLYAGSALLESPSLNKGSAFSEQERQLFKLEGLLPSLVENIEQQALRAYQQFQGFRTTMDQHIYLRRLQDTNETLFYFLLEQHIVEMLPIIYTPTVGDACEQFSAIYRCARGLFISYEQRHKLDDILRFAAQKDIKVIVVTDGERILGLGDQGIGGMGIPIGKLSLYTTCGGINPEACLPIMLDLGTNNESLLANPQYMGLRHKRIVGEQYQEFMDCFIAAIKRRWPNVLLQFEDFAQANAMPLLEKYRDELCCFNDDIQGTAAVAVGTLMRAVKLKQETLAQQKVVIVGAGSAGCGIAEQIIAQMRVQGLSEAQARGRIYMVDRCGLITADMQDLRDFQRRLAQPIHAVSPAAGEHSQASLLDVISQTRASILIGVSGQAGIFTQTLIEKMTSQCQRPIIFPLSNPSRHVEATPQNVIQWSQGQAIIATGSPFANVSFNAQFHVIAQCNNSYIFPGLGLAVIACQIRRISDEMLMAASEALANYAQMDCEQDGDLLPNLNHITDLSKCIAFSVAKKAMEQGYAEPLTEQQLQTRIAESFWQPKYRNYC